MAVEILPIFIGRLQRTARRYCNGVEVGACPNKAQKKRLKSAL
jgi:hypothetical protein